MKTEAESSVPFVNTIFSKVKVDYAGLSFDEFKAQRRQMVAAIIHDLYHCYLMLATSGEEYPTTCHSRYCDDLDGPVSN